jgi:hypothetical protein
VCKWARRAVGGVDYGRATSGEKGRAIAPLRAHHAADSPVLHARWLRIGRATGHRRGRASRLLRNEIFSHDCDKLVVSCHPTTREGRWC